MKFLQPWFWHYRCSGNRKTGVGLINPALRAVDASRGWDQEVIHRDLLPSGLQFCVCGVVLMVQRCIQLPSNCLQFEFLTLKWVNDASRFILYNI